MIPERQNSPATPNNCRRAVTLPRARGEWSASRSGWPPPSWEPSAGTNCDRCLIALTNPRHRGVSSVKVIHLTSPGVVLFAAGTPDVERCDRLSINSYAPISPRTRAPAGADGPGSPTHDSTDLWLRKGPLTSRDVYPWIRFVSRSRSSGFTASVQLAHFAAACRAWIPLPQDSPPIGSRIPLPELRCTQTGL